MPRLVSFQGLIQSRIPNLRPKSSKSISFFRPKRLKTHTLWGSTNLYSWYRGVTPTQHHPPDLLLISLLWLPAMPILICCILIAHSQKAFWQSDYTKYFCLHWWQAYTGKATFWKFGVDGGLIDRLFNYWCDFCKIFSMGAWLIFQTFWASCWEMSDFTELKCTVYRLYTSFSFSEWTGPGLHWRQM